VQGFLRHFWDEFEFFLQHGYSMVDREQGLAA
jgi:NADH-quinone oxidoreductase subunit F